MKEIKDTDNTELSPHQPSSDKVSPLNTDLFYAKDPQDGTVQLSAWRKLIPRGGFVASVLTLLTGSTVTIAIMAVTAPLLTRLFPPAEFALLALYASFTSVFSALITGRYEHAILLPEHDDEAVSATIGALILSVLNSIAVFVVLWCLKSKIISVFPMTARILEVTLYIPLGALFVSWYNIGIRWRTREKQFTPVAVANVTYTVLTVTIQLLCGFFLSPSGIFLIIGHIIGQFFAMGYVLWKFMIHLAVSWRTKIRLFQIWRVLKRYRQFPLFSIPACIASKGTHDLPVFILGVCSTPEILGLFSLCQRVLNKPLNLFVNHISHVFFQRISQSRNDCHRSRYLAFGLVKRLIPMTLPAVIILFFGGEDLFRLVFGANWMMSGTFARYLIPLVVARFIAVPLGPIMYCFEKQHIQLIWQVVLFCVVGSAFYVGCTYYSGDFAILGYSIGGALMYGVFLIISLKVVLNKENYSGGESPPENRSGNCL